MSINDIVRDFIKQVDDFASKNEQNTATFDLKKILGPEFSYLGASALQIDNVETVVRIGTSTALGTTRKVLWQCGCDPTMDTQTELYVSSTSPLDNEIFLDILGLDADYNVQCVKGWKHNGGQNQTLVFDESGDPVFWRGTINEFYVSGDVEPIGDIHIALRDPGIVGGVPADQYKRGFIKQGQNRSTHGFFTLARNQMAFIKNPYIGGDKNADVEIRLMLKQLDSVPRMISQYFLNAGDVIDPSDVSEPILPFSYLYFDAKASGTATVSAKFRVLIAKIDVPDRFP